jgi:hypothetical protein
MVVFSVIDYLLRNYLEEQVSDGLGVFNEVEGLHTSFFSIVIYATSVEKYL